MSDPIDEYRRACENYHRYWRAADEVLYDLCNRYRYHRSRAGINAKLLIIGRSYATGIERAIRSKGTQGSSLEQVGDRLEEVGDTVDQLIQGLKPSGERLSAADVEAAISAHGQLVNLLRPITHSGQSVRSFASKYLHFHAPSVPIYDNIAASWMPSLIRMSNVLRVISIPRHADSWYVDYVLRFWGIYQKIARDDAKVTAKYVDNYVLFHAYGSSLPAPAEGAA